VLGKNIRIKCSAIDFRHRARVCVCVRVRIRTRTHTHAHLRKQDIIVEALLTTVVVSCLLASTVMSCLLGVRARTDINNPKEDALQDLMYRSRR